MTTLDLLKENWKAGLRLPYPAQAADLDFLRDMHNLGTINGVWCFGGVGLWENGELLLLTARKAAGAVWLQLQTRGEL